MRRQGMLLNDAWRYALLVADSGSIGEPVVVIREPIHDRALPEGQEVSTDVVPGVVPADRV